MYILFGTYSFYGFLVGAGIPFCISFMCWLNYWREILCWQHVAESRTKEENFKNPISDVSMRVLFESQYYPNVFLQPLHWALWFMIILGPVGLAIGVIIDNWR